MFEVFTMHKKNTGNFNVFPYIYIAKRTQRKCKFQRPNILKSFAQYLVGYLMKSRRGLVSSVSAY